MDIDAFLTMLNNGSTGVIALIAYFLWRVNQQLTIFIAETRAHQENRDAQVKEMRDDLKNVIGKLAGFEV